MRLLICCTAVSLILALGAGCDGVVISLGRRSVTITLTNATDFPVDGILYTNDDEDLALGDIRIGGRDYPFDLDPGEAMTIPNLSCGDVQAVEITEADVRIAPGISPSASTETLFDGEDFNCGDTLAFTFVHGGGILDDLDIVLSLR